MATSKPTRVRVPLTSGPRCDVLNPDTLKPCRRAAGHHGRHYFAWVKIAHPLRGTVREVWGR